jgi:Bifunctional DNA primase/polymerase, N-terminal
MSHDSPNLSAALAYAADGWAVLPLIPRAKEPAIAGGFRNATTNPATVRRHWRVPDRNIGIATGMLSGLWVLDVDGDDGASSLRELEAQHGKLPPTWISSTGRGWHLWFKYTAPIPSSAGRIAPGIDARADNGYVVAPPSIHPTGRAYTWVTPLDGEPAEASGWLVVLARRRPEPSISERAIAGIRRPEGKPGAYGAAALDREIAELAATAPGSRNAALNCVAFRLFQLVAGGELDGRDVTDRLIEASVQNGLIHDDGLHSVVATIRSGSRAGLMHPRSRSGAA